MAYFTLLKAYHLFLSLFLDLTPHFAMWQELIDNTALSRSRQVLQVSSQAKGRCKKRQVRTFAGPGHSFKGGFLAVLETQMPVVSSETDEILPSPWELEQEIGKSAQIQREFE